MSARRAVVGATDHYARAELVTLTVRDGVPVLLDRRRIELIAPDLPSAPYHHECSTLEFPAALDLVERVRRSVAEHAGAGLESLMAEHPIRSLVLPASPYERLPRSLEEILSSRPLTNAADGMLYRELLAEAAEKRGLEVHRIPRKADPLRLAAEALGTDRPAVEALLAEFGKRVGPPWRKDHKLAAASALTVLGPL